MGVESAEDEAVLVVTSTLLWLTGLIVTRSPPPAWGHVS